MISVFSNNYFFNFVFRIFVYAHHLNSIVLLPDNERKYNFDQSVSLVVVCLSFPNSNNRINSVSNLRSRHHLCYSLALLKSFSVDLEVFLPSFSRKLPSLFLLPDEAADEGRATCPSCLEKNLESPPPPSFSEFPFPLFFLRSCLLRSCLLR